MIERIHHCDTTASDRCRSRSTIGLYYIAVDLDCVLAQLGQVYSCPQGASD
jgi:hypothetical protein